MFKKNYRMGGVLMLRAAEKRHLSIEIKSSCNLSRIRIMVNYMNKNLIIPITCPLMT